MLLQKIWTLLLEIPWVFTSHRFKDEAKVFVLQRYFQNQHSIIARSIFSGLPVWDNVATESCCPEVSYNCSEKFILAAVLRCFQSLLMLEQSIFDFEIFFFGHSCILQYMVKYLSIYLSIYILYRIKIIVFNKYFSTFRKLNILK